MTAPDARQDVFIDGCPVSSRVTDCHNFSETARRFVKHRAPVYRNARLRFIAENGQTESRR